MATKRSSGPAKKTPRTRKKTTIDPIVETPLAVTPTEPVVLASETIASMEETKPDVPVDEVRRRAYNYWAQGNPDPIANWFRAENELKQH